jgi:hypothetical protein
VGKMGTFWRGDTLYGYVGSYVNPIEFAQEWEACAPVDSRAQMEPSLVSIPCKYDRLFQPMWRIVGLKMSVHVIL